MASVNKVVLVGNCGRNPETRHLPSGQVMTTISLATSARRKDRHTGETVEDLQWHRVTFYDRLAEVAGDHLRKGRLVYVEGRLKYGRYVDQAGVERMSVDIVASELQFLDGREQSEGAVGEGAGPAQIRHPVRPGRQGERPTTAAAVDPDADPLGEIPF